MVSAMGMLFIYREEKLRQIAGMKKDVIETHDAWADSGFFGNNNLVEQRLARVQAQFRRTDEKHNRTSSNSAYDE